MIKKIKKIPFIRIYLSLLIFIISFFTLYAYRFSIMNYIYDENHSFAYQNNEDMEKMKKELSLYRANQEDMSLIYKTIKKYVKDSTFSIFYEVNVDTDEVQKDEMYGINLMWSMYHPNANGLLQKPFIYYDQLDPSFSEERIDFFFIDGVKGSVQIHPTFLSFIKPYSIFCIGVSFIFTILFFIICTIESKKQVIRKLFIHLSRLKIFKWTCFLSIKFIFVNVIAIIIALVSFFYMYVNRYSFFEFLFDYDIGYQYNEKIAQDILGELENMSFKQITKEIEENKSHKFYQSSISKMFDELCDNGMEINLYDPNILYMGGTNNTNTDVIAKEAMYYIEAVFQPFLYTYDAKLQDGIGSLWILYYPYAYLVIPYMIAITFISISFYLIISFSFTQKKTREIKTIYEDISIMASGDLHHVVFEEGNDEISELGMHLNEMRKSLYENMEKEKAARQANKDLISAISHDLRTPLTTLSGYLEIIKHKKVPNQKEKEYLDRCLSKVDEIKELSNKMFEYSLVYETIEDVPLTCITFCDLSRVLQENVDFICIKGFNVNLNIFEHKGCIQGNMQLLQRIFNNLFSNILKYGDSNKIVNIQMYLEKDKLCMTFCNAKNKLLDKVESNGIGLKSVLKIVQFHHGEVYKMEEEDVYSITLRFPMIIND